MADPINSFPSDPFSSYEPTEANPWDLPKVAHLLRRLTFGSSNEKIEAMLKLSPRQAVDSLLDYDASIDPLADLIDQMEGMINLDSVENVQRWWVYRMINSPQPAQEKIALFWHNRFATSGSKVGNSRYLDQQIAMFRREGLKSFRDLLIAVTSDPAMLVWLDGQSNRKGKPNENYSRELMELFTLGVGNYTEHDVQELARCFTGWQIRNGQSAFEPKQFDDGEKEIFGVKGKFDSQSAIDLILDQSAASKHLSKKLFCEFVHPEPPTEAIDFYAKSLLDNKWQIKPVLKQIATSRMFYSAWAYRSRIKSPAEVAVGGALAVGGKINMENVRQSMSRMGQNLLFPPNVKGWDGNETWINANTMLVRFNYGEALGSQRDFARKTDFVALFDKAGMTRAENIVDYFSRVLLDGNLSNEDRLKFMVFMARGSNGQVGEFVFNAGNVNTKVRGVIHLMMATPEYQLA
ncbi:MAG TPA: DUF1800 domain-containing protein [Tepidisphaeraceae bacterium]|nr:DUF1800 domain-containing protein [Tepidisphaeraceae bacterium]